MKQLLLCIFLFSFSLCLAQSELKPEISIFPNPTSQFLNIEDSNQAVKELKLFSILGKNVKNFEVNGSSRFNIMDVEKGLYLLQIINHQGVLIKTIRIRKI